MSNDHRAEARQAKQALRRELRARRRALPEQLRRDAGERLASLARGLPGWRAGSRIAAYRSADGEIDPASLVEAASAAGIETYLPSLFSPPPGVREPGGLTFRRWRPGEPLQPNRYGIGEPAATAPAIPAASLDLLCLPLVAFSADGTRLGMGAGYYDRALAGGTPKLLVGLAFDCQEVERLPREAWDVPLHGVLTESGWRRLG